MKKEKVPYLVGGVLCLIFGTALFWFGLETFPIVLVVYAVRVFWLGLDTILTPTKDYLVPLRFNSKEWVVSVSTTFSRVVFGIYLIILGPFSSAAVGFLWLLVLALICWDISVGVFNSYQLMLWFEVSDDSKIKAEPADKFVIRIHKTMEFLAICIAGYSLIKVSLDFLLSFV
jgi:hypothetical protein